MDTQNRNRIIFFALLMFISVIAGSFFYSPRVLSPISNTSGITLIFLSPTPIRK